MSMLLRKFLLDFYICILFPIDLLTLSKSITFKKAITENYGKSTWRIDGDKVIHIFEFNNGAWKCRFEMFENLTSENVVVDAADTDLFAKFQHLQTFRYEKRKNADTQSDSLELPIKSSNSDNRSVGLITNIILV